MTERNKAILQILSENGSSYTTIEEIAKNIGAGIRTVQRDLNRLEKLLRFRGDELERRRGYGIRLGRSLSEKTSIEISQNAVERSPSYIGQNIQRPMMLLFYLIVKGDWIKVSEIATTLYISNSTVAIDLNAIESSLTDEIKIRRLKGRGICLTGNETKIRVIFLRLFPFLFPLYRIRKDPSLRGVSLIDGLSESLELRKNRESFIELVTKAENVLGYSLSPISKGLLYSYFYLLFQKRPYSPLGDDFEMRFAIPDIYITAASELLNNDLFLFPGAEEEKKDEVRFLSGLLASCEIVNTPNSNEEFFEVYLGSLSQPIDKLVNGSLKELITKEGVRFDVEPGFVNYLKLVIVAALHRIDLGLSQPVDFLVNHLDDSASQVFVSNFLSCFKEDFAFLDSTIIKYEIREATLAVSALIQQSRNKSAEPLKVRILCYEGLGMSSYIYTLSRGVFPPSTTINYQWDPEFAKKSEWEEYDLIISTFPIGIIGAKNLVLDGNISSEEIVDALRTAFMDMIDTKDYYSTFRNTTRQRTVPNRDNDDAHFPESFSPAMKSIIENFFFKVKNEGEDFIAMAIDGLDSGDCDRDLLYKDFVRRESFGSLVLEELNIRILHCRSDGIPAPRAGVIQDSGNGDVVLVLSAPKSATLHETYLLSEIMIALTEEPEFAKTLSKGTLEEVRGSLFQIFKKG